MEPSEVLHFKIHSRYLKYSQDKIFPDVSLDKKTYAIPIQIETHVFLLRKLSFPAKRGRFSTIKGDSAKQVKASNSVISLSTGSFHDSDED